jgi:hypothetical protein
MAMFVISLVGHCLLQELLGVFIFALCFCVIIVSCKDLIFPKKTQPNYNFGTEGNYHIFKTQDANVQKKNIYVIDFSFIRIYVYVFIRIYTYLYVRLKASYDSFRYKWNSIRIVNLHNRTS